MFPFFIFLICFLRRTGCTLAPLPPNKHTKQSKTKQTNNNNSKKKKTQKTHTKNTNISNFANTFQCLLLNTRCPNSKEKKSDRRSPRSFDLPLLVDPFPLSPLIAGEVGQVTLDAIDWRAEYSYQSTFRNVPQVLWGLCGYDFDLDTREDPMSFGYGYPTKEPNAIGVFVDAYSTKTTVTFEAYNMGFGDTSAFTSEVCFQACTIGPGPGPVNH